MSRHDRFSWVSISRPSTGAVFAVSNPPIWDRREWLLNTITAEFGCDEDDISFDEDEDGREFISIGNVIVAEIHAGFHQFAPVEFTQG